MVTTYWGFYIPYLTMVLLVPMGFGFSYMMIHLAKESERRAKLAKETGPKKVATINISDKWLNWVIIAIIAFLVFLNIAAYNAALTGFKNLSLFWTGLILFVFAAFFHVYRYSMGKAKNAPPPLPPSIQERPLGDQLDTKETPELADPDKPDDKTPKE